MLVKAPPLWETTHLVPPREKKMNMVVPINSPSMAMKPGVNNEVV